MDGGHPELREFDSSRGKERERVREQKVDSGSEKDSRYGDGDLWCLHNARMDSHQSGQAMLCDLEGCP